MSLNASCHYTQNIIHGDIKPDNLLVTSTGSVKIGDFSVSQIFEVGLYPLTSVL
jgi:serine/threonine protein kinase